MELGGLPTPQRLLTMEKRGDLREDSHGDIDPRKKVKYVESDGPRVAGEGEQHLLKNPVPFTPKKSINPYPPGYSWPVLN